MPSDPFPEEPPERRSKLDLVVSVVVFLLTGLVISLALPRFRGLVEEIGIRMDPFRTFMLMQPRLVPMLVFGGLAAGATANHLYVRDDRAFALVVIGIYINYFLLIGLYLYAFITPFIST